MAAVALENLPAAQVVQLDAPCVLLYVPERQAAQGTPSASDQCPMLQTHSSRSALPEGELVLTGHGWQSLALIEAVTKE